MMKQHTQLQSMVIAALLCAIGIVIPMVAPKIVLGPASFTLASHVPIFIAVFISPPVALIVAIGTTIGFFFSGLPIVIVLRALTHVVFAMVGAFILKTHTHTLTTFWGAALFGLLLAVLHAVSEVTVVTWFYFENSMPQKFYANGYFVSVIVLVGLGTVIHSMIDYYIAVLVWKPLSQVVNIPYNGKVRLKKKEAIE